jgi:two-component system, OmpR family, alkaline phosphatase synthesis response regulator PhoP
MAKSIFIVEDDENIQEIIVYNLEKNSYETRGFLTGQDFLNYFKTNKPDLVILDLMLPDMDGYEICKIIKSSSNVPVLILSAKGEELDKVLGLELGAEDYMVKPFGLHEFLARIKNIIKRSESIHKDINERPLKNNYKFDDLNIYIDEEKHEIILEENLISLNPKEFQTFSLLLKNIDNLVSRNDLIRIIWGDDYYGDTRTLDVHIRRIREKMSYKDFSKNYIKTIHGLGYKLISGTFINKKKI